MPSQPVAGDKTPGTRGQILVVFVIGIFAIIAMVGLIIEGGNVFAQQRIAQNGSDSASTAGAIIVAESLSGKTRTDQDVFNAVKNAADANELADFDAIYTDDTGNPIGADVQNIAQPIPAAARGVRVGGDRTAGTSFARLLGINSLTASADATVVAGELSGQCVMDEDGCALIPISFPVKTFQCDGSGNLLAGQWIGAPPPGHGGEGYWPIVGAEDLPGGTYADGNPATEAILPLCKGTGDDSIGGTFGYLDLDPNIHTVSGEITGPLTVNVDIPDWYQTQTGNLNSTETALLQYLHTTVLIPLYNGVCDVDPGATSDQCPTGHNKTGDPNGNNTWYYVHTLGNFYIQEVNIQGANVDKCAAPPGSPVVPITTGGGFLGCLKGWFVNYITAGPIVPGGCDLGCGNKPIGIQMIR
jgi:hypothetical protein